MGLNLRIPHARETLELTPDGRRYLAIGQGERTARPFHYRWLIPTLCHTELKRWLAVGHGALIALIPLAYLYAGGHELGLAVAAVPPALAGVWAINRRFPILIDAPAMALALGAAVAAHHHLWPLVIVLALAAGATKETAPVFAAVYAWSWLPLVGLVAVAARALQRSGPDTIPDGPAHDALEHPIIEARKAHTGTFRNPAVWTLPWGALLVGLCQPTWQVAACAALAYGQCAVATDRVRLYQWAWPVVAVQTFAVIPRAWWLFLVVVMYAHPWHTDGV